MNPSAHAARRGVRRVFLGWERPVLHSAADRLVRAALGGDGDANSPGATQARRPGAARVLDLSAATVVLPGSRAGRRLEELLLERSEQVGRPLRPPRFLSPSDLPEAMYRPERPVPTGLLARVAWERALATSGQGRLDSVFPTTVEGEGPLERAWWEEASLLRELEVQVGATGHGFRDVARLCRRIGAEGSFVDEERWTVLAEVQERYRTILRSHGHEDRSSARRRALARGMLSPPGDLWVIGVPDLPPVHRDFLRGAAERVPVHLLVGAPEEFAGGFDELGCLIPARWAEATGDVPDRAIRVVEGPAEQAEAVLEHLAEQAAGLPPECVTVGVPDREVIPYVVERLGEVGVPVRDAGGLPLVRTSDWRLLEGLVAFLDSRDFDRGAAMVRHPSFEGALRRRMGGESTSLISALDRYRSVHMPGVVAGAGTLPEGGESGRDRPARKVRAIWSAMEGLLAHSAGSRPLSAWADPLAQLLEGVFGDRDLDRHREGDRARYELLRQIGGVLEGLPDLPASLDAPIAGPVALRLVLDELRAESVPPPAERGAVELLGWLELALDDAPVLVVTGVNEPHLPDSVSADPFLPHTLRRELGMLDNEGRWARDLLHLRTLLATRADTLLITAKRNGTGSPLLPSRLLLAEDPITVANRIRWTMGDGSTLSRAGAAEGDAALPPPSGDPPRGTGAPQPEPAPRGFRLPPDPVLAAPLVPHRISVTAFRVLLADPWRYALERVLRLEAMDDSARELDGSGFGNLAHVVLETFGRGNEASATDPDKVRAALREILHQEARSRFGARPLPAVRVQVEQLHLRLRAFADWQVRRAEAGWRIRAVEVGVPGDGVPFDVDGTPILLSGKIDRVDVHEGTGECVLVDYKTGDRAVEPEKSHRGGRGDGRRWIDLQLPLYLKLAPHLVDPNGKPVLRSGSPAPVRAGYLLLPSDPEKIDLHLADWTEGEVSEALSTARDAVRLLRRNRFEHDPDRRWSFRGDPLEVLRGRGVLRIGDEGEEDDEEGDDD